MSISKYARAPPPLVDSSVYATIRKYASPVKEASYIVEIDPDSGNYVAVDGQTGTTTSGDPGTLIQAAVNALT